MKLRPYQEQAVKASLEAFETSGATLLALPTGTGKTIIFAHLLQQVRAMAPVGGNRVMVMTHVDELLTQSRDKIHRITGLLADVEKAESRAAEGWAKNPIVVASVQTLCAGGNGGRMSRFDPREFCMLVVDEAHHATASTWRRSIDYFRQNPDLKVVGVTATPDRHDEQALGQIFETCAFDYGLVQAITDGWLVDVEQEYVYVDGLDYTDVRTTAGELNGRDLAEVLEEEKVLHPIADETIKVAGGRKTLVFTASVAQAERTAEIFNRQQPESARFVCGKTPRDERRALIEDYKNGVFQYLVNVGVATEGFDVPDIGLVSMARPTKSRPLYAQMVGRGTRALPGVVDGLATADDRRAAIAASGKANIHVLDFVGVSGQHKLITAVDILGGKYDDDVIEIAKESVQKEGGSKRVLDELEKAQMIARERRAAADEKNRAGIIGKARTRRERISPFDALDLRAPREPGWHKGRKATDGQIRFLEKKGVKRAEDMSFHNASTLIGELIARHEAGSATLNQVTKLAEFGVKAMKWTFDQANKEITKIAGMGWNPKRYAASVAKAAKGSTANDGVPF